MILGIDASNIKAGGGFTHLFELLNAANPTKYGFSKVIVYGGAQVTSLPNKEWLEKRVISKLSNSNLTIEMLWRLFTLPKIANKECDLIFAPGGIYASKIIPYVSMSQNMLIWENRERRRLEFNDRCKHLLTNHFQKKSFRNADGIIFISEYAKQVILNKFQRIKHTPCKVIYHGVSHRFTRFHKSTYENFDTINILYVSILNYYKFQWNVIEAIKELREEKDLKLNLHLVGSAKPKLLKAMKDQLDNTKQFVTFHGKVDYKEIEKFYHRADVFIFASTCENMPNILLEAMSANLKIASSNYGPMPEILKDAGVYFDPEYVSDIKRSLLKIINNKREAEYRANLAYHYSQEYKWEKTANETFSFFKSVLNKKNSLIFPSNN